MSGSRGTAAVAALCALAAAGCGLGPGSSTGEAELTVTRDYGGELLSRQSDEVSESDTVLRLLDRHLDLETRYGGGFVQSIDGLSGGIESGRSVDWFFYVNGIESPVGSADYRPRGGDRIWWDYRDWTDAMRVPAVVGSFPEPFVHGFRGQRWDTEVVCLTVRRTCELVAARLEREGVRPSMSTGLASAFPDSLRVLVGPWERLRPDHAAGLLAEGPGRSGVFARFSGAGLELLDERGAEARTEGEAGLIAALRPNQGPPTWLVTGTGAGAVATLAAPLLDSDSLEDDYALAISPDRGALPVPLASGASG